MIKIGTAWWMFLALYVGSTSSPEAVQLYAVILATIIVIGILRDLIMYYVVERDNGNRTRTPD